MHIHIYIYIYTLLLEPAAFRVNVFERITLLDGDLNADGSRTPSLWTQL